MGKTQAEQSHDNPHGEAERKGQGHHSPTSIAFSHLSFCLLLLPTSLHGLFSSTLFLIFHLLSRLSIPGPKCGQLVALGLVSQS